MLPLVPFTLALRFSVDVPAAALELPASNNVHDTTPDEFTVGELHDAVKPFGNPEVTLMLDPAAPLAALAAPKGVAETVTVAAASDCTETDAEDTASVMPAA